MRRFAIMVAAAILTVLPQAASAAVYNFYSAERSALSPSLTFDFALDTGAAIVSGANTSFGNVTISRNGVPVLDNTVSAAFTSNITSSLFFLVDTGSMSFYTGTGTDIRFNTGSFVIADGFTNGIGTLSIADASPAAVPEVSTWASLFVGLGVIGGALRFTRKRQAGGRALLLTRLSGAESFRTVAGQASAA